LKTKRFDTVPAALVPNLALPQKGIRQAWTEFWLSPVRPTGLHVLRVLAGLVFLSWLLPLAGDFQGFFGAEGWFDRRAYLEASRMEGGPPTHIGWSLLYPVNSSPALLTAAYWGSILVLVLYTLGLWTRVTAVLAWLIVVSFLADPAGRFEADFLLVIPAFYLMIGYLLLGQWSRNLSPAERLLGQGDTRLLGRWIPVWPNGKGRVSESPAPSYAANLALRLFQVHFAVIVVVSALDKLQHMDWWSGVAFWYPQHSPFETTFADVQAAAKNAGALLFVLSLAQYLVLAWQLAFPFFAWRPRWRLVLLGGAVIGWLGCIFLYRLPLFGPFYVLGCVSYVTAAEWQWVARLWSQVFDRTAGRAEPEIASKVKLAART
jgi:hypothetical protein